MIAPLFQRIIWKFPLKSIKLNDYVRNTSFETTCSQLLHRALSLARKNNLKEQRRTSLNSLRQIVFFGPLCTQSSHVCTVHKKSLLLVLFLEQLSPLLEPHSLVPLLLLKSTSPPVLLVFCQKAIMCLIDFTSATSSRRQEQPRTPQYISIAPRRISMQPGSQGS